MKIDFSKDFKLTLGEQVRYIAKDKPIAARRFKNELIKNLKKDLKKPFHFKKSIYSDGDENIRDYVFKGYICVYKIDMKENSILVFGFIKYRNSL